MRLSALLTCNHSPRRYELRFVFVLIDPAVQVKRVRDVGRDQDLNLVLSLPVLGCGERRGLWGHGVENFGNFVVSQAVQIERISDVPAEKELGWQHRLVDLLRLSVFGILPTFH